MYLNKTLLPIKITIHSLDINKSPQCFVIFPLNMTENRKSYPSEHLCVFLTLGDWLPILEVFLLAFLVFQLIRHIPGKIKRTGLILLGQRPISFIPPSVRPGPPPCPGHLCGVPRLKAGSGLRDGGSRRPVTM